MGICKKSNTFCGCSLALNGTEPGVQWVYVFFFLCPGAPKSSISIGSALKHLSFWTEIICAAVLNGSVMSYSLN